MAVDNILNPITAYRKERNWSLYDLEALAAMVCNVNTPEELKELLQSWRHIKKDTRVGVFFRWAMRDSNPHSCGYEPRALTVKLMALTAAAMPAHCHNG